MLLVSITHNFPAEEHWVQWMMMMIIINKTFTAPWVPIYCQIPQCTDQGSAVHHIRMVSSEVSACPFEGPYHNGMRKMLQRQHISQRCLLNPHLWNGSAPLCRRTPSDTDVVLNLYHSTAQLWSCKCLSGTSSSHKDYCSPQQCTESWHLCNVCDSVGHGGKPTEFMMSYRQRALK